MDVPIPYLSGPSTIVNQAIDLLGVPGKIIGDITDGTPVAEAARRNYGTGLRQLLRTAHWDFSRKRAKLELLGDATGNSQAPISPIVEWPWTYAWAWPNDCVQGRWLPWSPANAQPTTPQGIPLTTGVSVGVNYGMTPGRFLVSSSDQYPAVVGFQPWNQLPDLSRTEGVGYVNRKIILTDCCDAHFVYTRLVTTIEEFDSLFRQAFVTMMALAIAPTAIEDPKLSLAQQNRLIPILRNAIADARVANGNEAGYPQGVDFEASWIRGRNQGNRALVGAGAGQGYYSCGWESMSWGGQVY